MSKLSGQVVLITGVARGIGAETAKRLVGSGARVVLVDLDEAPLQALGGELGTASAVAIRGDVCDLASSETAAQLGVDTFGGLDVVMANAGISSCGSVLAVDPEAFKQVVDMNLTGLFNTFRAALPHVIERKGHVLVVCSLASYAARPGLAAYNASKAGAEHFANALRPEVAYRGVTVGSAHMSWIDTPPVHDPKADLSAFRQMLEALPRPLGSTTSVEACANAFVRGIEKRSTRTSVPGWIAAMRFARPWLATRAGAAVVRKEAARLMPLMDEEVAALGRSMSAGTTAPQEHPAPAPVTAA